MNNEPLNAAISFTVIQDSDNEFKWSAGLEILFALAGENKITTGTEQYDLKPGGLFVVNPFGLYRVNCGREGRLIIMHIPREYVLLAGKMDQQKQILCRIKDDDPGKKGEFDQVRVLFARIFRDFFQDRKRNSPRISSETLTLIALLMDVFSIDRDVHEKYQRENVTQRLERILNYIHDHWREEISLAALAKQEYLTPNYLSRFFQKHLRATFTEYLNGIRLRHAMNDLLLNEESVTHIAYENGFKNVNSFIEQFRFCYGMPPGQYRKQMRAQSQIQIGGTTSDRPAEDMTALLKYADRLQSDTVSPSRRAQNRQIRVDAAVRGRPLRHTWRRLVNIGYARDGLVASVQEQLRRAQEEIGFEYLRFHGIFDEDMHVYRETHNGIPEINFTYIDLLFDFIQSIGLTPYVELSYMPNKLAKEKLCFFDRPTNISIAEEQGKWTALIRETLRHFISRYGLENVLKWRFTTMGIHFAMLSHISYAEYYLHYSVTRDAVKSIDDRFLFGGPGGFASAVWDNECMRHFLDFAAENNCLPDFFCTQCYPHRSIEHDGEFMDFTVSQASSPSVLSRDESFTRTLLHDFRALLAEYGLGNTEIWLEEWNSTLWQRDLSSDTCYKAAWLFKNIGENYDRAEAFGYWLLTDFIEERASLGSVFHGGYGLFTYNGISKSGWQAMTLLRQMGDTMLAEGDGWFVTRSRRSIQIFLSHYCHYDNLYRYRYHVLDKAEDAYRVFVEKEDLRFTMNLEKLEAGDYIMRKYAINRENGSSFDQWMKAGQPAYMRVDELKYLAQISLPSYYVQTLTASGSIELDTTLSPHEIQLIVLTPVD
ncbi:MAG: hypothetical protein K0R19_239 [Bacillota bacterium]|jgi:xylan 1,4-beta-xylosidase|nr:hypothetical protein [Bacillota bacterium]